MKKFLFTLLLAGMSQMALAHTKLSVAVPADEAVLDKSPAEIVLEFTDPVRLTSVVVALDDTEGEAFSSLPAALQGKFVLKLPSALADGDYKVSWRAMAEDTHVMTGELSFKVQTSPAAVSAAHAGAALSDAP